MPDKVFCFAGGLTYSMRLEIFRRCRYTGVLDSGLSANGIIKARTAKNFVAKLV